ncbi:MAG: hypothetical protein KAG98_06020 [Lentisphaeria bacterium]|nr:hypothetical protein [Lentisphaeria bacterium]
MTKFTTILSIVSLILTGCGSEEPINSSKTKARAAKELISASTMLTVKPTRRITVSEARKSVVAGKKVTLFGQVGGVVSPFVAKRASMVIADHTTMKACNTSCAGCKTPWDFCCEPPEVRRKNTVTIQFIDKDGMIIRQGLENFHGIKNNSMVTIVGEYAPESNENIVIINAENIFLGE